MTREDLNFKKLKIKHVDLGAIFILNLDFLKAMSFSLIKILLCILIAVLEEISEFPDLASNLDTKILKSRALCFITMLHCPFHPLAFDPGKQKMYICG